MKNLKSIFLFLIFTIVSIKGQGNEDYFPFKSGNLWEYVYIENFVMDTLQSFSIKDTVNELNSIFTTFTSKAINPIKPPYLLNGDTVVYKIDKNLNVYHKNFDFNQGQWVDVYRLNGKAGEQWVMWDYGGGPYEIARIESISDTFLFGKSTKLMSIHYFAAVDSIDTLGLDRNFDQLLKGFGLYSRCSAEGLGCIFLTGAVIDNILYGDTTQIVTSVNITHPTSSILADKFKLLQNYPNPFNPTTAIEYQLAKDSYVTLIVYNMLGEEIVELVNGFEEAGYYSLHFDGSDLPSGMYIYKIQAGDFSDVRKMLLLK